MALENPIAAAAAVAGTSAQTQNNAENLLDIDFDGAAPASLQKEPQTGASGLEGLAGTPQRIASPVANASGSGGNNLDDLLGVFGDGGGSGGMGGMGAMGVNGGASGSGLDDLMGGFGGLDMGAGNQPPPPGVQLGKPAEQKKNKEDILDLI